MKPNKRKPDWISQEDWDAVDSPGLTDDQLRQLKPVALTNPEIIEAFNRGDLKRRGPQKTPTKTLISIRYSPEVLDYFRATGPGWQTKMDEALKQWIHDHPCEV